MMQPGNAASGSEKMRLVQNLQEGEQGCLSPLDEEDEWLAGGAASMQAFMRDKEKLGSFLVLDPR